MTGSHTQLIQENGKAATPLLANRVALITGASSGIGAACAKVLAEQGAKVILGYNSSPERAEAVRASLHGEGHRCVRISLEDTSAHLAIAEAISKDEGKLDILVNSAGYTQRIPHSEIETLTPELFNEILIANAGGPYSITRAFLPLLRESGDAVVITVSSVSAFTGLGSNMAYCAAKAAVDTLTVSLARAFGHGIRFLCVSPASVDTDFVAGRNREELEKKAAKTPLGRVVTPEDVAASVLACVTHLRTATGTRLVIDGGHVL